MMGQNAVLVLSRLWSKVHQILQTCNYGLSVKCLFIIIYYKIVHEVYYKR